MSKLMELQEVTKKFGPVTVFKNVSFSLEIGEIVALVGENGAGKSTLMNVISGTYPVGSFEGKIIVDGNEQEFHNNKESKNVGIEMIHQEISLHLDLSVAENIFLGNLENQRGIIKWKKINESAEDYLEMVKLNVSPEEAVRNLSTSQQQLLSIAKALACHPKILLFDEPTSALTETDAANLLEIIRNLSKKGIACLYISHKLEEVMEIADRIIVLRDGHLISDRKKEEIKVDQVIEDMVGRKLDEMYPKQKVMIGEEVFRVENLTVTHPYIIGKNIVEDISFSVCKGEILGISGLVGSGRSEAVNAIYGSLKKESGKVFLFGKEIRTNKPMEAISKGIGLVTEDRKQSGIVAPMCLRENMTLASLKKISRKGIISSGREEEISKIYYEKLKVKAEGIEDNIMNLSGGNQQKIVLSRWLMKDINVLILDEPTRGVDVGAKVEIYNIITELVKKGIAVIMISSELPELLGMCDRLLVFGRGKINGNLKREEITQEKVMRAATCIEKYGV